MSSKFFGSVEDKSPVFGFNVFFRALIVAILSVVLAACGSDSDSDSDSSDVVIETTSIAPSTTLGRPNDYLGCIETPARAIDFKVWDTQIVDGDIVSLIANGNTILSEYELTGTPSGSSFTLPNNGFNYLVYYAHNTGSLGANTAGLTLDGGAQFDLAANLDTNGYVDIVVTGYGVTCADSSGTPGGSSDDSTGSGSGGACATDNTGEITIYTTKSTGGATSVQIDGGSVGSLTSFYNASSPPACGSSVSGAAITRTLSAGSHSVFAEDDDATWGPSNETITQCGCLLYRLD